MPTGVDGWIASSKDHLQSSSATIESYVLSINPFISQFGQLQKSSKIGTSPTYNGVQGDVQITAIGPANEWLMSGVGGHSTYNGVGRMLFSLYPTSPTTATIKDKDHSQVDSGTLWGYMIMIKPL